MVSDLDELGQGTLPSACEDVGAKQGQRHCQSDGSDICSVEVHALYCVPYCVRQPETDSTQKHQLHYSPCSVAGNCLSKSIKVCHGESC